MSNTFDRKAYIRKHYQDNKEYYEEKARKRELLMIQFIRAQKTKPCVDCQKTFPYYVMDFDHRPGEQKCFMIGRAGQWCSLTKLRAEMAKCDLVCANCHRERTHQRQ